MDPTASRCPLCVPPSPPTTTVVEGGGRRYVRCACGLVRLERFPTEAEIAALVKDEAYGYGDRIDWDRTYESTALADLQPWANGQASHRRLQRVLSLAGLDVRAPLRLHDIGCSEGLSLYFARQEGWQATGNDFSEVRRAFGRRNLGVDFPLGRFADVEIPAESLDVVVLRQVLEHLPDPLAELSLVRSRLRVGGALVVEVPNFSAPTIAFTVFRQRQGWRQGSLSFIGAPEHLWQFSQATLASLLVKAGFTLRVSTTTATFTNHSAPVRVLLEQTLHRAQWGPHLCVVALRG